jgi:hypothetical protein
MNGTPLPTANNWLLCSECLRYFTDADIGAEDQSGQWCAGCTGDLARRGLLSPQADGEGREP